MKLKVSVEYRTEWGEELVICIGGKRHPLHYVSDGIWEGEVSRLNAGKKIEYRYEVVKDGKTIRKEWGQHTLVPPAGTSSGTVISYDRWNDRPEDSPLYSSAFTEAIFCRDKAQTAKAAKGTNVLLKAAVPYIQPDEALALAGNGKGMDSWTRMIPFDDSGFPTWTLALEASEVFEYKLVIINRSTMEPIVWEEGANRWFTAIPDDGQTACEEIAARFNRKKWRGAGTAIPVFSLRSEDDFGVGEFYDLKKMADWAAATGQCILQLLPINDTTMFHTWEDSYPYNPNSTFALHPQYINLPAAGVRKDKEYKALQAELNALDQIDYVRVNKAKLALLRKAYDKTFKKISASREYQDFIQKNEGWLMPYAAFCVLRDTNGTPDFNLWKEHSRYHRKKVEVFCESNRSEIDFWCFIQYHLDLQLSEVCEYAHSKGVIFKGDLPIGISRTSVDAWLHPELFHMDSQAGAPPDAFAEDGQNWGFPTYNWEKMAEDDYAWWKARLAKMSEYFDAFRIDHILGFFRIWEIPLRHKSGLEGYFNPALPYPANELRNLGFDVEDKTLFIEDPRKAEHYHPKIGARQTQNYTWLDANHKNSFNSIYEDFFYHRNNEFWKEKAMQKLPALLDSTRMLACGEDLGMIPSTVPQVMSDLRILSLEIQRMPKAFGETFADPAGYPYLSVCTTSTHDMNPVRAWWREDRIVAQQFWTMMLKQTGDAPDVCDQVICRQILDQHLLSPAMLTIIPLQDWLSMDAGLRRRNPDEERINIPAKPRHYWRYRMHLTIERLSAEKEFNTALKEMISASGRYQK